MDTNTTNTVTSAHRVNAHTTLRNLRINRFYDDANVLDAAINWESFPNSYSAMQVELAQEILILQYGTEAWYNVATAIFTMINEAK